MNHYAQASHLRKMAECANTLLVSGIKIRHGRKWKSRCCALVKLSPVSDQVILKFYKSEKELQVGKELRRERLVVAAHNFCGIESCFRHPKNHFVLTVVCTDKIALLSFSCHADLLDWYHKIRNQLTSASEFKCRVAIPNRGKLPPGPAMIYIYDNHFAITSPISSQLYGGWSLADVTRYGVIEDGFAFDVVSTKDGGTFVVLCSPDQAERLKTHMEAATHCVSNRWSHISDTVSVLEENIPNRRDISNECQNQVQEGTDTNSGGSGNVPSLPGSPRSKYRTDAYTNTKLISMYKTQASSTDSDELSVRERLLEEIRLELPGSAQYPNRNSSLSSTVRTDADGNVVDIFELYRALTLNNSPGATNAGASENSNGSEETTFINHASYVRTPTKKTPIREQNYEIMASFDRFRNPMPVSHQRLQLVTDNNSTVDTAISLKSKRIDNDYVNLPSPKNTKGPVQEKSDTVSTQNAANNEVTNAKKSPKKDTVNAGKDVATACVAREHENTLGDTVRAPLLAKAANANSYKTIQHANMQQTGSNGNGSVPSEVPSLPSTPIGKSFPPPFENLTQLDLAVRPKRLSKTKNNAPVPFDHGDLIKPIGPIAMLSLETNMSSTSGCSSESGDDVGHTGSSELLDEVSERSSSLRSRGRSLSRSRSRSESCDNGHSKDAIRPEDLPSPLPPDPLRCQLSGHLSDPSLLDSVDENTYLDLSESGRGSPSDAYDFLVERRPASPTSDPSSIMSPFGKKMSLRRDSTKGSSVGTTSPCGPLSSPTNYPVSRKRCNTEPTAEFIRASLMTSSTWSRSRSNSRGKSLDIEEGDGYLMMKPVYEEKLKRCHVSKGIPQSPLHGVVLKKASTSSAKLRRSATVSGEVSAMSPRMVRSLTLRERTSAGSTPPASGTLTYRRPRGNSEGIINPGDIPRSTNRTDRTKHHYGPALDPGLLKRLTNKLNKFASSQGNDPLPEITNNAQFAIDPDNLGSLNNNIHHRDRQSSKHTISLPNHSLPSSQNVESPECSPNGYNGTSNGGRHHDHNANAEEVD